MIGRLFLLGIINLYLVILYGCNGSSNKEPEQNSNPNSFEEMRAEIERDLEPDTTADELSAVRDGNVTLGFNLYHALADQGDENLAVSPYSLGSAFAMLQAAAVGQTETEIADAMGFIQDQARLHSAMNSLDLALQSRNMPETDELDPVILETANRVFTRIDRPVGDDYLEILAQYYGAGVFLADFAGNPEGEREKINSWVEQKTYDRIVDLIPQGTIVPNTSWVIINALYLKAPWTKKFNQSSTFDAEFTLLDGTTVNVPTMHGGGSGEFYMSYVDGDGYKLLDMPLRGENLVVTFLLPDENTYTEFETGLNREVLDSMLAETREGHVSVSLPKFEIETGSMNLSQTLVDLGMPTPFSNQAQFPGLGPDLPPSRIAHVFQSVFVAADETGVEAAAATAIMGVDTSMPVIDMEFDANRPFIFMIRDIPTGLVLFLGRVMDPSKPNTTHSSSNYMK